MKQKLKEILFSLAIGLGLIALAMIVMVGFFILSYWTDFCLFPYTAGLILLVVGYWCGREIWRERLRSKEEENLKGD